jgi:hypothetical protein
VKKYVTEGIERSFASRNGNLTGTEETFFGMIAYLCPGSKGEDHSFSCGLGI